MGGARREQPVQPASLLLRPRPRRGGGGAGRGGGAGARRGGGPRPRRNRGARAAPRGPGGTELGTQMKNNE